MKMGKLSPLRPNSLSSLTAKRHWSIPIIVCLLVFILVTPAWSGGYGYYGYYPYHAYSSTCRPFYGCAGISPAAAIALGSIIVVAIVAGIIYVKVKQRNQRINAEMLESALNANQYENYQIGLRYYNADSQIRLRALSKKDWIKWRESNSLEVLK